jgi:phage tail-like protein
MADDSYDRQRITAATFLVEVDGVEIGRFMEISGLEVTIETDTIAEGGQNSYSHKVPKRMSWPNITLKRGVTQGNGLFDWLNTASGEQFAANNNRLTRHTAAITLIGPGGDRLRAWEFDGAFPVKWSGPNFSVSAAEAAVESLEITHHGFRARDIR